MIQQKIRTSLAIKKKQEATYMGDKDTFKPHITYDCAQKEKKT